MVVRRHNFGARLAAALIAGVAWATPALAVDVAATTANAIPSHQRTPIKGRDIPES